MKSKQKKEPEKECENKPKKTMEGVAHTHENSGEGSDRSIPRTASKLGQSCVGSPTVTSESSKPKKHTIRKYRCPKCKTLMMNYKKNVLFCPYKNCKMSGILIFVIDSIPWKIQKEWMQNE